MASNKINQRRCRQTKINRRRWCQTKINRRRRCISDHEQVVISVTKRGGKKSPNLLTYIHMYICRYNVLHCSYSFKILPTYIHPLITLIYFSKVFLIPNVTLSGHAKKFGEKIGVFCSSYC
jgi:hypothetical protein